MNTFTNRPQFSRWCLFSLLATLISIGMLVGIGFADINTREGVLQMIRLSARIGVPFLFIAFVASALQTLIPGNFSRWLLLNRKYFGLLFAYAMGWQLFLLLWAVVTDPLFYDEKLISLPPTLFSIFGKFWVLILGGTGYFFIIAMTLTSFQLFAKVIKPKQWQMLHKTGIYYLWLIITLEYSSQAFFRDNPIVIPLALVLILAYLLRVAAWITNRAKIKLSNS